jgi:hypothetical protein
LTLEIPWQPTKFRTEVRVCGLGRAGLAIVPRQGCSKDGFSNDGFSAGGFSTGKARQSMDI